MSSHFLGLTHVPLGKKVKKFWDDGQQLNGFFEKFQWLLESPGVGILTGEPGVGKTAALRQVTQNLNPHRYQLVYMSETDFGRVDIYCHLAIALGLEPSSRRAKLWKELKSRILELYDGKNILPVWVIDEAQNLPANFFLDLPSFLNFALDSRDVITIWLIGHPILATLLDKAIYSALASRISLRVSLKPIIDRDRFHVFIDHALKEAGSSSKLLSESGLEVLRQASQGKPRQVSRILQTAMRLGAQKGLTHLPDELLQAAIEELK